jgi:hypothetical protein
LPSLGITKLNIGSGSNIVATNYPNPFVGKTQLKYTLPYNSNVSIRVFDINGRVVANLLNSQKQSSGVQVLDFNAEALNAGVYYAEIISDYGSATVKMMVQ